jgi:hypothetical protein
MAKKYGDERMTKKRKRKSDSKPVFHLRVDGGFNGDYYLRPENCPWHNAERQERFRDNIPDEYITSKSNVKRKPSSNNISELQLPSERVLSQIDAEIQSFSAYVRLTPSERNARSSFLDHIAEIAVNQFSSNGGGNYKGGGAFAQRNQQYRSQRRGGNTEEEDSDGDGVDKEDNDAIHVVPFGSFATQEICTFASDVDMCVWGIVKGETTTKPPQLEFVGGGDDSEEDEEDASQYERGETMLVKDRDECAVLTESSLLRTMDAIQSAASVKQKKSVVDLVATDQVDKSSGKDVSHNVSGSGTDAGDGLFFIDRVGEERETTEEDTTEPSNDEKPAATKESLSDEQPQQKKAVKKSKQKQNTESFQFVFDVDGVQELGGEVDDLVESSADAVASSQTNDKSNAQQKARAIPIQQVTVNSPQNDELEPGTFAAFGNLSEDAINVDDDSDADDGSDVVVLDDDDSADKMSSFYSRKEEEPQDQKETHKEDRRKPKRDHRDFDVISVGDSSSDESTAGDKTNSDEVLELSLTSNNVRGISAKSAPITKPVFGPTGKIRMRVVSVLQSLTTQLRRSSFTHTIECRSRAKVPIINCNTRTGFEGDIAIGGHNGVDTSAYAMTQVKRFFR